MTLKQRITRRGMSHTELSDFEDAVEKAAEKIISDRYTSLGGFPKREAMYLFRAGAIWARKEATK